MKIGIVLQIFGVICSHPCFIDAAQLFAQESYLSWPAAAFKCMDNGIGPLVNLNTSSLNQSEWNKVIVVNDDSYWTGGYYSSDFYRNYGCYNLSDIDLSATDMTIKSENSLANCVEYCSSAMQVKYIGLMKNLCYCLPDEVITKKQTYSKCNKTCIGDEKNTCGQDGFISVYKLLEQAEVSTNIRQLKETTGNCVTVRKTGGALKWDTTACSDNKQFLCKKGAVVGSSTNTTFRLMTTPSPWTDSSKQCMKEKMELVTVVLTDTAAINTLPENTPVWTSLYRRRIFRWVEDAAPISEVDFCIAVQRDSKTSKLKTVEEICDKDLKFVCQKTDDVSTVEGAKIGTLKPTTIKTTTKVPTSTTTVLTTTTTVPTTTTTVPTTTTTVPTTTTTVLTTTTTVPTTTTTVPTTTTTVPTTTTTVPTTTTTVPTTTTTVPTTTTTVPTTTTTIPTTTTTTTIPTTTTTTIPTTTTTFPTTTTVPSTTTTVPTTTTFPTTTTTVPTTTTTQIPTTKTTVPTTTKIQTKPTTVPTTTKFPTTTTTVPTTTTTTVPTAATTVTTVVTVTATTVPPTTTTAPPTTTKALPTTTTTVLPTTTKTIVMSTIYPTTNQTSSITTTLDSVIRANEVKKDVIVYEVIGEEKSGDTLVSAAVAGQSSSQSDSRVQGTNTELIIILVVLMMVFAFVCVLVALMLIRYRKNRRRNEYTMRPHKTDMHFVGDDERFIKEYRRSAEQANPSPKPEPRIDVENTESLENVLVTIETRNSNTYQRYQSNETLDIPWIDASRNNLDNISADDITQSQKPEMTSFSTPAVDKIGTDENSASSDEDPGVVSTDL